MRESTVALTSVAGATPKRWEVRYWDENLLQGPPPGDPVPEVVGITVHLTFARRAYELARWFRARGSIVVFGGLHVLSCPEECAAHADAIAIGDGVQTWPEILGDIEKGCLKPRYFAGCYLYKRSNRLWHWLIKNRLVHAVWRPLVELTRLRHLAMRYRRRHGTARIQGETCRVPFPAGV
jgi:radical SAM superfamily enzyme YgiQ (UPF0313 family)